jgi:hypothetical protein
MVAGSESCRFEAKIANVESPPIDISIYLSEDQTIAYHLSRLLLLASVWCCEMKMNKM